MGLVEKCNFYEKYILKYVLWLFLQRVRYFDDILKYVSKQDIQLVFSKKVTSIWQNLKVAFIS